MENKYKNKVNHDDIDFDTNTKKLEVQKETYYDDETDRAFVEYDPAKDTRKYCVYRNDIKFKKHRLIDPSRAIWDNDVKNDYKEKETDSIHYRLEECEREKYETLDLSHMPSDCFLLLLKHKKINLIKKKILHLFANDCGFQDLPDLSIFSSLITCDLSDNKLKVLPELPESLQELIVNGNNLTQVNNELPVLKRFNGSNNMITLFNYANSLESIYLNDNPIDDIPKLSNLYFLNISKTKITKIHSMPKLKYLDCSHTEIQQIPSMNSLTHLSCNDSSVHDISQIHNLHSMEISNSKITQVHYMKDLYSIIYQNETNLVISKRYKIIQQKINKKNITEIMFE